MKLSDRLREALELGRGRSVDLLAGDFISSSTAEQPFTPAAVLVPIVDRPQPGVILTVRNDLMRKHAGQVAFPGGRIDPEDAGPVAAALREAEEEIGLPPGQVEVIGTTDRYRTITGYDVTPVIGVVPADLPLRPQQAEVADIFETPLHHILRPEHQIVRTVVWQGRERSYYEIEWQGRRIWGATAAMIVNLTRRLEFVA